MGRRKTRGVIRERKDYTGLLLELQGQPHFPAQQTSTITPPKQKSLSVISPYRQRMMSDESIRYFYSKQEGKLHDKSCPEARNIPDEELCCSEKYMSNISQCPLCAVKAYVRLGARDFYNFPLYERLFQRMRFAPVLLRRMYVNEKMRTSASNNGLTIWGKEDSWRLEFADESDRMRLMHNNYYPLQDGTRIFTGGYHLQAERATANYAFTVISQYTYEGHKAAMVQKEQLQRQQTMRISQPQVETPKAPTVWEKLRQIFARVKNRMTRFFHK